MNRLIVVVGPTAVGKSDLAMQLAQRFDCEIISGDSMCVYRGLDIGTAKPSPADRRRIAHHLIDIRDPGESFSVVDFQKLAGEAIADINHRGKIPLLVGGTGLYVQALLEGYRFNPTPRSGQPQAALITRQFSLAKAFTTDDFLSLLFYLGLLTIESVAVPGKGKTTFTGKLGDVMQESIKAAITVVRRRADRLGISADFHEKLDLHIHVPEGATPKDGPSAGIAMTTALVSVLTGIPVRADVAMTGEITLRGEVLAIGGLKEKLLAAHRGGIKLVLIPEENVKDLVDIPEQI